MPELPEVETVLRGVRPHVQNQCVRKVVVRKKDLRWHIPDQIKKQFPNHRIVEVSRRGKYLLFKTKNGTAIMHFGMSGSITLLKTPTTAQKHDHFDLVFDHFNLRYTDPRRFGALLWIKDDPLHHPLLAHLGIEPLDQKFTGRYLYQKSRGRRVGIKQFIMNSAIVVGVGNIYAAEALFLAGINPFVAAKDLGLADCSRLVAAIKKVLIAAIDKGGTTLRNFIDSSGKPGYFKQALNVYGREGLPCNFCQNPIKRIRSQNRSTFFCPICQK